MEEKEILKILRNSYDIEFKTIEILREGGCISYTVNSEDKKFLMKAIPQVFMDTAKQSLDILLYLNERGFPAPHIILIKKELPYIETEEEEKKNFFVLFDFIIGQEPEEGQDIESLGMLVGQLHSIMKEYNKPLPEHGKEFFIERYLNILEKKQYDKDKIEIFREYGDALWEKVKNLPRGFCHGDLHRGNLLKTAGGKYFLLDFDTSSYSFPAYDIMVLCNSTNYFDFKEDGFLKSKRIYERFLKGYLTVCPLTATEQEAFYDLIAVYHYQLQATIIEIYGLECVDNEFLDRQLDWLMKWRRQCSGNILCKILS